MRYELQKFGLTVELQHCSVFLYSHANPHAGTILHLLNNIKINSVWPPRAIYFITVSNKSGHLVYEKINPFPPHTHRLNKHVNSFCEAIRRQNTSAEIEAEVTIVGCEVRY